MIFSQVMRMAVESLVAISRLTLAIYFKQGFITTMT